MEKTTKGDRWIDQLNELYNKILTDPSIAVKNLDKANEAICEAIEKLRPLAVWKNNKDCPNCGAPASPEFRACETGLNYCSDACANEHVERVKPEGGW